MKPIPTLLRIAEHQALSQIELSGTILDLGGDTKGEYLSYIKGEYTVTTVNLDPHTLPNIVHDLELPLPISDAKYDGAILINVLEHVFEYRQLLAEAVRVVRPGGKIVVVVPFLFPVHPDPHDYWRFSGETLTKEFERLGLSKVCVDALGSGVFAARYVMLDRLLPVPLRFVAYHTLRHLTVIFDRAFVVLARILGKKYLPSDYALGYCATGTITPIVRK